MYESKIEFLKQIAERRRTGYTSAIMKLINENLIKDKKVVIATHNVQSGEHYCNCRSNHGKFITTSDRLRGLGNEYIIIPDNALLYCVACEAEKKIDELTKELERKTASHAKQIIKLKKIIAKLEDDIEKQTQPPKKTVKRKTSK